jgi:hypothetical protein
VPDSENHQQQGWRGLKVIGADVLTAWWSGLKNCPYRDLSGDFWFGALVLRFKSIREPSQFVGRLGVITEITIETSTFRWFNRLESVGPSQVAKSIAFGPSRCKWGAHISHVGQQISFLSRFSMVWINEPAVVYWREFCLLWNTCATWP